MNATLNLFTASKTGRIAVRSLFASLFWAPLAFLAGGCAGPAKGPTDPKEFIIQRRSWVAPDATAMQADAQSPVLAAPSSAAQSPSPSGLAR